MKPSRGRGDKGETSLYSAERVPKTHARIEACGDVDELNSVIGGLLSAMPPGQDEISGELRKIQSALLTAGALLGTTPGTKHAKKLTEITTAEIEDLEAATDRIHSGLPKLKGFVLPSGHESASWAHVARTVCRRAERRVVELLNSAATDQSDPRVERVLVYLNRLSDYFFCVARHNNKATGTAEDIWKK
jgi:cob(I)alamin adenosyltransferase